MNDTPAPTRPVIVEPFQIHLSLAIRSQTKIGWNNILRGLVAKEWGELQGIHYRREQSDEKYNTDRWENSLIESLMTLCKRIWKERCDLAEIEDEQTKEQRVRHQSLQLA